MIRIKNLMDWYKVPTGEGVRFLGKADREVELKVNTAGPCIVYVQRLDDKGEKPLAKSERYMLGMVDNGQEAFVWRMPGNFVVTFDATGEVWIYRDQTPLAIPGKGEPSFVRLEKMGVHVDELGVALHRQAVLNRLQRSQETVGENVRAKALEKQLADLTKLVESLKPKEVVQADPPAQVDA